jgi:hypothetical protein
MIAKQIIAIAKNGERDPLKLSAKALAAVGLRPGDKAQSFNAKTTTMRGANRRYTLANRRCHVSRFDRLTFDGSTIADAAVDQSRSSASYSYFDTGNQCADDVFKNATVGLLGGGVATAADLPRHPSCDQNLSMMIAE